MDTAYYTERQWKFLETICQLIPCNYTLTTYGPDQTVTKFAEPTNKKKQDVQLSENNGQASNYDG